MDITGYILIGAGPALLVIALIVMLLRRRKAAAAVSERAEPVLREEPTLIPAADEVNAQAKAQTDADPAAAEDPVSTEAPVIEEAPAAEPVVPSAAETVADAEEEGARAQVREPEPQVAPVTESTSDPITESTSDPITGSQAEAGDVDAASDTATDAASGASSAPGFLAARKSLDEAIQAGHFSRLDVFEDYQRASEKAYGHIGPRSEYFNRVVNEAIGVRDVFEALLCDEDRERFIDVHSRYLDDVSTQADADRRNEMHQEQIELLRQLRPKPVDQKPAA